MNSLVRAVMRREGITEEEAIDSIKETFPMMDEGQCPEEILIDQFSLEPDYLDDYLAMYDRETE
jgi:hypothetical protein